MTRTDHQIIFSALGFLAVILSDVPQEKQAVRAKAIAKLIEDFCVNNIKEETAKPATTPTGTITQLFSKLINDNQQDTRMLDALEALESCLAGDALASEAAFNKAVDAASEKFLN